MFIYEPGLEADTILLNWWADLTKTGEMAVLFQEGLPLSHFLSVFRRAQLTFDHDAQGVTLAVWGEPLMDAILLGVWVRADKRQSPGIVRKLIKAYKDVFRTTDLIMGVTRQPDILADHEKFGYTINGPVRGLWGPGEAWIVTCQKADFEAAVLGRFTEASDGKSRQGRRQRRQGSSSPEQEALRGVLSS